MPHNPGAMIKILNDWSAWKKTPEGIEHDRKQTEETIKRLAKEANISVEEYIARKEAEYDKIFGKMEENK